MDKLALDNLREIVGRENVLTELAEMILHGFDGSKQSSLPEAVVRPQSVEQTAAVMKLANTFRIPVTPRGAATGLTGGAVPLKGGISLDMTCLNRILEIDTANLTALVEPGVVVNVLQKEAEKRGLFYPPDPASHEFCTIGGTVAECAGGLRGVKYGVTRDYVMALEVVTPTGEILHTGAKTLKSVTGYDLTRLLVGSEGTLGIFTKILLKLIPLPLASRALLAQFPTVDDAAEAVSAIVAARIQPRALELMEQGVLRAVVKYQSQNPFGEPLPGAALLIECDGAPEALDAEIERVREVCLKCRATNVRLARNSAERDLLWKIRRAISPAIYSVCKKKMAEDICVPRNQLAMMVSKLREIGARHRLEVICYGHAGDGNLHVNVLLQTGEEEEHHRAEKAVADIFRTAIDLGGTLTGEHGIGNTKSPFLSLEIPPAELALMKQIKAVFDPRHILNPGKIFND